jgi:hypothetical protein
MGAPVRPWEGVIWQSMLSPSAPSKQLVGSGGGPAARRLTPVTVAGAEENSPRA